MASCGNKIIPHMPEHNSAEVRLLQPDDLAALYEARYLIYSQIFKEYMTWAPQDKARFNDTIDTDLRISAGAFVEGQLACFVNMGSGQHQGQRTAYNSLTGTLPGYRGQGLAQQVFEVVVQQVKSLGYQQMVLEVMPGNLSALALYRKAGFTRSRAVESYTLTQPDAYQPEAASPAYGMVMSELPHWELLQQWQNRPPAWQNRQEAIERGYRNVGCIKVYFKGQLAGQAVYYPTTGTIAQIATEVNSPNAVVYGHLLDGVRQHALNKKLQLYHIDATDEPLTNTLKNKGFTRNATFLELTAKV